MQINTNGIKALSNNYNRNQEQQKMSMPAVPVSPKKPGDPTEVDIMNADMQEEQSKIDELAKEMEQAIAKGEQERGQLLQSSMSVKQQELQTMRMQVEMIRKQTEEKENESSPSGVNKVRYDRYLTESKDQNMQSDSLYRVEGEGENRTIIFTPPEEQEETSQLNADASEQTKNDEINAGLDTIA